MAHFISAGIAGTGTKFSLLLLGSLAGVLAAGTAGAADNGVPAIAVKYTQQSLATDGGVQDLYRRIRSAARQVCPQVSILDLSAQREVEQCRKQAVARAVSQIDNSRLAALYATHSKSG